MENSKPIVELKHLVDAGTAAHIRIDLGEFAGVYQTRIREIRPGSISFDPLVRLGDKVSVRLQEKIRVLLFADDVCYRYSGEVVKIEDEGNGNFEVLDAPEAEILGLRKTIRISTNIPCSYTVATSDQTGKPTPPVAWACRIVDMDVGGVGLIGDCQLPPGAHVRLEFTLPQTVHGQLAISAKVVHARPVLVKGKERFQCGLEFAELGRVDGLRIFDWIVKELERTSRSEIELRTADPTAQAVLANARAMKVQTMWDRAETMQPQCAFGELGICCRNCLQGPCRIDPFGQGAKLGICGVSAEVMVARNLVRMVAAGTSSHVEHGHHLVEVLTDIGQGRPSAYSISDVPKLRRLAARIGVGASDATPMALAAAVAQAAKEEFFSLDSSRVLTWLRAYLPEARLSRLAKLKLLPGDLHGPIVQLMHRTHTGVDTNAKSLLFAGLACSMADFAGMHISTDISDVLFGVPTPRMTSANLAVIKEDAVNIAVHGHNPLVSELVCRAAREAQDEARVAGATGGINVVGVCCTGNEVLMRYGVPLAANFGSQELAILTGALDAMVVDYQCVVPGIVIAAECFHTKIFTTLPVGRLPESQSVTHVELGRSDPDGGASRIVKDSIEAFKRRDRNKVSIPTGARPALVGLSTEAIVAALAAVNPDDPLQALVGSIAQGNIAGVALLAGCNNLLVRQDHGILTIAKDLLSENVLVLATGCCGGALAKAGLMTSEATEKYAGAGLKQVLTVIGDKAGLGGPLPPVFHMGSCVDNSRAVDLAVAVANKLGVDIDQLPIVVSAPEPMSEKAISIAVSAVTMGFPVHLGIIPPVMGAPSVVSVLTEQLKELVGGYFIVELNPNVAAEQLLEVIRSRRKNLGI